MNIEIRIAMKEHCEAIQSVFNHRDIIEWLGGFTHLKNIQDRIGSKGGISMWYAIDLETNQIVGATEVGGRPQAHFLKYGQVAVLPEYQRRRIGTALYFAMTCQGILEGRRHFEDTIVGDNPYQFSALPKLGLEVAGVLKAKTASFKDIALFQLELSRDASPRCIAPGFAMMSNRFLESSISKIHLATNHYTRDLWQKNWDINSKYSPEFNGIMEATRMGLLNEHKMSGLGRILVHDDPTDPTVERRKEYQQTRLI